MRFKDFRECYFAHNEDCPFRHMAYPMGQGQICMVCGKQDDELCLLFSGLPVHVNCLNLRYNIKEKRALCKIKYHPKAKKKIRKGLPKLCHTCNKPIEPEKRFRKNGLYCGSCIVRTGNTEGFYHPFFRKHDDKQEWDEHIKYLKQIENWHKRHKKRKY